MDSCALGPRPRNGGNVRVGEYPILGCGEEILLRPYLRDRFREKQI